MENEVKQIINELRPFLMSDGGNIEFVKIEDDIVYIELQGACAMCPHIDFTLNDSVKRIIIERLPSIKDVRLYEEE